MGIAVKTSSEIGVNDINNNVTEVLAAVDEEVIMFPPHVIISRFMFKIEPKVVDTLFFKGSFSNQIVTTLFLTNKDDYKQSFKIKCSKNDTFRIQPSHGVLAHGERVQVTITYQPTPNFEKDYSRHHFGIFHIPCSDGAHPLGIWETHFGPPQGALRLKVKKINLK
uniref:Major sperm protein n=1 Tax=Rhabditophanes sp. KR3021 TaxID=114890 RepID=A0AC35UDB3_9BILA